MNVKLEDATTHFKTLWVNIGAKGNIAGA